VSQHYKCSVCSVVMNTAISCLQPCTSNATAAFPTSLTYSSQYRTPYPESPGTEAFRIFWILNLHQ
jgi:hypothetical protein